MSELGQKRKWRHFQNMSAVPPTTDIRRGERHVPLCAKTRLAVVAHLSHINGTTRKGRAATLVARCLIAAPAAMSNAGISTARPSAKSTARVVHCFSLSAQ